MALLIGGTLALILLDMPWSLVVIALLAGVEVFEFRIWRWAVRQRPRSGIEALVGMRGVLIAQDRVKIQGTSYPAKADEAAPGDEVVVDGVDGMRLVVSAAREGDSV